MCQAGSMIDKKKAGDKTLAFFLTLIFVWCLEEGEYGTTDARNRPGNKGSQKNTNKDHCCIDASFVSFFDRGCVDVFNFHDIPPLCEFTYLSLDELFTKMNQGRPGNVNRSRDCSKAEKGECNDNVLPLFRTSCNVF